MECLLDVGCLATLFVLFLPNGDDDDDDDDDKGMPKPLTSGRTLSLLTNKATQTQSVIRTILGMVQQSLALGKVTEVERKEQESQSKQIR